MKELLLASANPGKIEEIRKLLSGIGIQVKSLTDVGFKEDIEESGSTFLENARIKARELASRFAGGIVADDSGLEVDALGGLPGVHSKRFSQSGTTPDNNKLLVQKLQGIANRKARFVSCIVYLDETRMEHVFFGTVEGEIIDIPRGNGGFGYDPLFFLPQFGKTMAELTTDEKNMISHRGRAIAAFVRYLEETK